MNRKSVNGPRPGEPSAEAVESMLSALCEPAGEVSTPIPQFFSSELDTERKLALIAASLRELGRRWKDDYDNFFDVTVACARIQCLLHDCARELNQQPCKSDAPTVMIAFARSEHHTLMPMLVDLLFKHKGWSTIYCPHASAGELAGMMTSRKIDLVCISWNNPGLYFEIRAILSVIATMNPKERPPVIAGGSSALEHLDKMTSIGVDCICDDVYSAISIAERYMFLRRSARTAGRFERSIVDSAGRT